MSTRTINADIDDAEGNPTDVDSIVVAGPGVTRTDTNAVVVAAGVPFVRDSLGHFSLTFTEPTPGLSYNFSYTYTLGTFTATETGTLAPVLVVHFTTRQSASNFGGQFNADSYFNKSSSNPSDPTEVDANWEQALSRTDSDIRLAWRYRLESTGTTFSALAPTDPDELNWLAETADWVVIIRGYEGRGEVDAGGKHIDGAMTELRKRYEARLQQIRDGDALLLSQSTAGVPTLDTAGNFKEVPIRRSRALCGDENASGCW